MNALQSNAQLSALDATLDAWFGTDAKPVEQLVVRPTTSFSHLKPAELGPALKKSSTRRLEDACKALGVAVEQGDDSVADYRQTMRLRIAVLLDPQNKALVVPKDYSPRDIFAASNKRLLAMAGDPTLMSQEQALIDGKPERTAKYSAAGKRGDVLKAERRAALGVAKRQPFADDEVRLIRQMFDSGIKPAALSELVHGRVKKDMMWYIGTRRSYKNVSDDGPVAESLDRWMRTEDAADAVVEQQQAKDVQHTTVVADDLISNVLPFSD